MRRRLLRIALYAMYPLLGLSALLLVGIVATIAFVVGFAVENRTGKAISVTPVGAVGSEGHRVQLPVVLCPHFPLPAFRAGGFRLADGEAITIRYDMDDVNFSEIVVEDEAGGRFQLVTDPDPTRDRYHGPLKAVFRIDDLRKLAPVRPEVDRAAIGTRRQPVKAVVILLLLVVPWIAWLGLRRAAPR